MEMLDSFERMRKDSTERFAKRRKDVMNYKQKTIFKNYTNLTGIYKTSSTKQ